MKNTTAMNIEVVAAAPEHQHVLANLLELYQHDFTEFADWDIGDDGRFGYDRLPSYFSDPLRYPHLIRVDGHWAGFALVRRISDVPGEEDVTDMTEFFIMRKYRGKGVASIVARRVFDLFPGEWQVRVMRKNVPAQAFWRRTVGAHTGSAFEERSLDEERWQGLVLSFVAPGERTTSNQ